MFLESKGDFGDDVFDELSPKCDVIRLSYLSLKLLSSCLCFYCFQKLTMRELSY